MKIISKELFRSLRSYENPVEAAEKIKGSSKKGKYCGELQSEVIQK